MIRKRRPASSPSSSASSRAVRSCCRNVKDRDVKIGNTPKTLVFQTDKITLHHYKATAKTTIKTPVLVCYGLVGTFKMADLQEDRSLIRNLLAKGIDVYVVDWGTVSRGDRWLTLDDYIDGYLNECVDFIRSSLGIEQITLLGICEGGVFTLAYAALYPKKVKNLILTITPVDFHAGEGGDRPNHGFISLWTRSLSGEDVDRLIEANGNLPGELMSFVFSMMTPLSSLTKYNVGLYDVMDEEGKLLNFLRMEKWLQDRPHHPGEAAKQWLKELYQENRLVKGTLRSAGEGGPEKIKMPSSHFASTTTSSPGKPGALLSLSAQAVQRTRAARRACRCLRQQQVAGNRRQRRRGLATQTVMMAVR